jgi:D-alanine-D-alanine ligase
MALRQAYHYGSTAIVESYIEGREVAISVMDGTTFPPVEIVAPGGFYDFAAKYKKAQTRYLCPAPLSPKVVKQLEDLAVRAYTIMECTGVARVDFRLNRMSRPFVLEVNTIPGMTERSLLPMASAEMGLPYDTLVEKILESAVRKHKALGV